jgi:hypothetical protein
MGSADVEISVSHQEAGLEIQIPLLRCPQEHSRLRFSAAALATIRLQFGVGMVRAVIDAVQPGTGILELPLQELMRFLYQCFRKIPPAHPALVGDEEGPKSSLAELPNGFCRPRVQAEAVNVIDVSYFLADCSVAVKEDGSIHIFPGKPLTVAKLAMKFICGKIVKSGKYV